MALALHFVALLSSLDVTDWIQTTKACLRIFCVGLVDFSYTLLIFRVHEEREANQE